jgi:hypothetical protein
MPAHVEGAPRLGAKVLVVTPAGGPSDVAVRAATLLTRPDGGHGDVLITRAEGEAPLERADLRAVAKRVYRHGFDGHVRSEVDDLADAVRKAVRNGEHSLVIVDDATFKAAPGSVPLLVLDAAAPSRSPVVQTADGAADEDLADEIKRRLAKDGGNKFLQKLTSGSAA